MSQPEARAWWADVEDLRERIESRRSELTSEPQRARARGARRTVQITGQPSPGPAPRPLVAAPRERPSRALTAATRSPDRIAGWAALLGLVLVLVSTATN
jgi:hypothetical protein